MSSGKNPLVWMMALAMPGAAQALGLGDIHVTSGLNERLVAQIDIVGATPLELAGLRAQIANRETFARFGADRPAFLSSMTFNVAQDAEGNPVLTLRSSESFTEPVVNILVDLNWRNGSVVRQYTLLLDPTGFSVAPAPVAVAAAPVAVAPSVVATPPVSESTPQPKIAATPAVTTPVPAAASELGNVRTSRKTTHVKVGAHATLRGIAWRVGERSETDLQRMMLAIYRANPTAFDGNINRLHRGAVLSIPSRAEVAAISKAEAQHEIHAQMMAWRSHSATPATLTAAPSPAPAADTSPVTAANVAAADVTGSGSTHPVQSAPPPVAAAPAEESTAALDRRVQSLEKELSEMQALLVAEREQLFAVQREAARQEKAPVANPPPIIEMPRARAKPLAASIVPLVAGAGALAAALGIFLWRRRVPASNVSPNTASSTTPTTTPSTDGGASLEDPPAAPEAATAGAATAGAATAGAATASAAAATTQAALDAVYEAPVEPAELAGPAADEATHPALPALPAVEPAAHAEATQETTVNMLAQTVNLSMSTARLDYNLLDLDLTAQHVQMPSVLNENAVVKERRTNLADVLKSAIEREPDRHDLRMKLLELYYSAAATNRTAFLEVVQKLARDHAHMDAEQWDKIAFMGRQIAAENPMFAEPADDEDLADCA